MPHHLVSQMRDLPLKRAPQCAVRCCNLPPAWLGIVSSCISVPHKQHFTCGGVRAPLRPEHLFKWYEWRRILKELSVYCNVAENYAENRYYSLLTRQHPCCNRQVAACAAAQGCLRRGGTLVAAFAHAYCNRHMQVRAQCKGLSHGWKSKVSSGAIISR